MHLVSFHKGFVVSCAAKPFAMVGSLDGAEQSWWVSILLSFFFVMLYVPFRLRYALLEHGWSVCPKRRSWHNNWPSGKDVSHCLVPHHRLAVEAPLILRNLLSSQHQIEFVFLKIMNRLPATQFSTEEEHPFSPVGSGACTRWELDGLPKIVEEASWLSPETQPILSISEGSQDETIEEGGSSIGLTPSVKALHKTGIVAAPVEITSWACAIP